MEAAGVFVTPWPNLPPAWRLVRTSSTAGIFHFGCMSTGMPRPSSRMETEPSTWMATSIFWQNPARCSSMELSSTSKRSGADRARQGRRYTCRAVCGRLPTPPACQFLRRRIWYLDQTQCSSLPVISAQIRRRKSFRRRDFSRPEMHPKRIGKMALKDNDYLRFFQRKNAISCGLPPSITLRLVGDAFWLAVPPKRLFTLSLCRR